MTTLRVMLVSALALSGCAQTQPPRAGAPATTQTSPGATVPAPPSPVVRPAVRPAAPAAIGNAGNSDERAERSLRGRCKAQAEICNTWAAFRLAAPWPYQAIGARKTAANEFTLVISEPPPTATRVELDALLRAVFGTRLIELARLRFPTGIDGWLEDTVVRVRIDEGPARMQVLSGHNLQKWQLPAELGTRLRYLHAALAGTREGFYVDDLASLDRNQRNAVLPNLSVTAKDIEAWLASDREWVPIGRRGTAARWLQLRTSIRPAAFYLPGSALVALAIPRGATEEQLAEPLRLFGVAADIVVAAVRSGESALVLVGRMRQVPLTILPPLRLEAVMRLAAARGQELGQSYERGRIFAGKLDGGPLRSWDWAPIYLSAQLEDSEFGTLLNLADQVLKSWSEHGEIDYLSFNYPHPRAFPFGATSATGYFYDQLRTTSLTFNWNTSGFTTLVELPLGKVVAADGTAALPITYIPGGNGPERRMDPATSRLARDAADRARGHFAKLGNPILVRVAQQVLLYHAIGSLGPDMAAEATWAKRGRTEAANDALRREAERWLASADAMQRIEPAVTAELNTLRRRMGMTDAQIADMLANPHGGRLAKQEDDLQRTISQVSAMQVSLRTNSEKYDRLFDRMCKDTRARRMPTAGGERCEYQWPNGTPLPPSVAEYRDFSTEFKAMQAQFLQSRAALDKDIDAYKRYVERYEASQRIALQIAGKAGDSWDEVRVLDAVLKEAANVTARGSIQTPSVVVSRNAVNLMAVGGHNIGAGPTRIQIGEVGARPILRRVGTENVLSIAPDQLASSSTVVRRGIDGTQALPSRAPLTQKVALQLDGDVGQPVMRTVSERVGRGLDDAEVVRHFENQDCGVCVLRDPEQGLYVLEKGPPKVVHAVDDYTVLPDLIRGARSREVVRFEGVSPDTAAFVAENVRLADARQAAASRAASPFKRWIDGAASVFGVEPRANLPPTVLFTDAAGVPHRFSLLGGSGSAGRVLRARVAVREARVFEPPEGAVAWLRDVGRVRASAGAGGEPLVTVVSFPQRGGVRIDLGVVGHYATPPAGTAQATSVRQAVVGRGTSDAQVAEVLAGIRAELNSRLRPQELEFFVSTNAGDLRVAQQPATAAALPRR